MSDRSASRWRAWFGRWVAVWSLLLVLAIAATGVAFVVSLVRADQEELAQLLRGVQVAQEQNDELLIVLRRESLVIECLIERTITEAAEPDFDARKVTDECKEAARLMFPEEE